MNNHILLVEDDPISQTLITDLLEDEDFNVTVASDGKQAQTLLGDNQFLAIISDLFMPNLDGVGLIEWLMEKTNGDTPVYVLTGSTQPDVKKHLESLSVKKLYYKPLSQEQVSNLLLELNGLLE